MPFQLEGTSAIQAAPFGSVPVKCALAADADEPVPATSVTKRTATRSVLRSELPRRFTTDLPLLVPALRLLCLRRQTTRGVSNVAGYLSKHPDTRRRPEVRAWNGPASRGAGRGRCSV